MKIKYDVDVVIRNQYSKDVYNELYVMLIFKPKNLLFRPFFETLYEDFSIKHFLKNGRIELKSFLLFEEHGCLSKNEVLKAYNDKRIFMIDIKDKKFEIPIPYCALDWLLDKGDGSLYRKKGDFGDVNKDYFRINFNANLEDIDENKLKIKKYSYVKAKENMDDFYPF